MCLLNFILSFLVLVGGTLLVVGKVFPDPLIAFIWGAIAAVAMLAIPLSREDDHE